MTTENPVPTPPESAPTQGVAPNGAPQYGQPQYGAPQYGTPQYGTPQYGAPQYGAMPPAYRAPVRPPLTPRNKRGAFWGGAVGFSLLSFGWVLVIVPIAIAAFGTFFAFVFNQLRRDRNFEQLNHATHSFIDSIDFSVFWIIGLIIALIGLAIMAAGLFTSAGILRGHGVARAWPVTWAGAGIAIAASWVVGWVPLFLVQAISSVGDVSGFDSIANAWFTGVLGFIVSFAVTVVIGWLAWWWMAHVLRPAEAATTAAAAVTTAPAATAPAATAPAATAAAPETPVISATDSTPTHDSHPETETQE